MSGATGATRGRFPAGADTIVTIRQKSHEEAPAFTKVKPLLVRGGRINKDAISEGPYPGANHLQVAGAGFPHLTGALVGRA
jgi:hypothetical protein